MSTPGLVPADGDPPEDPAAAQLTPAQRDPLDDTDTPRTEHPLPESFPSGGSHGANP